MGLWRRTAPKIRTIWFLVAMIPVVLVVGFVAVAALALTTPLMLYAKIYGIHLKGTSASLLQRKA